MAQETKKNMRTPIIIGVLVVALIAAAFYIGNLTAQLNMQKNAAPAATAQTGTQAPAVTLATIKGLFNKDLIKFGKANSKLLFVEVADPSCPFCHIAGGEDPELNATSDQFKMISQGGTYVAPVQEIKKLVDAGKASFVYIYDPGHGNGEMGMRALYCAFEKGKFWQVNSLIMSQAGYQIQNGYDQNNTPVTGTVVKNDKTKSQDMANFLAPVIDPTFMNTCLSSGKYDARLGTDTALASSLGVSGTPGFFVNATPFAGAYSFTDMQSAVNAALK